MPARGNRLPSTYFQADVNRTPCSSASPGHPRSPSAPKSRALFQGRPGEEDQAVGRLFHVPSLEQSCQQLPRPQSLSPPRSQRSTAHSRLSPAGSAGGEGVNSRARSVPRDTWQCRGTDFTVTRVDGGQGQADGAQHRTAEVGSAAGQSPPGGRWTRHHAQGPMCTRGERGLRGRRALAVPRAEGGSRSSPRLCSGLLGAALVTWGWAARWLWGSACPSRL